MTSVVAQEQNDTKVVSATKEQKKLARPGMFKVLMHNDDYTTRDFVVEVLKYVFHHSESKAVAIMLHVHNEGVGVAGVYTRDVAETKIETVHSLARRSDFPLRLTMEPDSTPEE